MFFILGLQFLFWPLFLDFFIYYIWIYIYIYILHTFEYIDLFMFDLDDGKKRDLRRDYAHGSLTLLWLCAHTVCVSVRLCVCVCVCARTCMRACACTCVNTITPSFSVGDAVAKRDGTIWGFWHPHRDSVVSLTPFVSMGQMDKPLGTSMVWLGFWYFEAWWKLRTTVLPVSPSPLQRLTV